MFNLIAVKNKSRMRLCSLSQVLFFICHLFFFFMLPSGSPEVDM